MRKPPHYRVVVNMEWTSKCNARCVMCPRTAITHPSLMSVRTFRRVLARLTPEDVWRSVIAGYGEPSTHPLFDIFVQSLAAHPVRFDMVTNGQQWTRERFEAVDGILDTLIVSFSSIEPEVYREVHANLNQQRVMANIALAQKTLRKTRLAISLTPVAECLPSLPATTRWLRSLGITELTMSPSLYNRAGTLAANTDLGLPLRQLIQSLKLHSQELDFIPSLTDALAQRRANRFNCAPRNSDLFISSEGHYLYCYNDIAHHHPIGNVDSLGINEVLRKRETMAPAALCGNCNMRDRYRARETLQVASGILLRRLKNRLAGSAS